MIALILLAVLVLLIALFWPACFLIPFSVAGNIPGWIWFVGLSAAALQAMIIHGRKRPRA